MYIWNGPPDLIINMSITIQGDLTFDVREMLLNTVDFKSDTVQKIKREPMVDPDTFVWHTVDLDTWFTCLSETGEGYHFPLTESENRDNNYQRVKQGMKYFITQGWTAYKIQ